MATKLFLLEWWTVFVVPSARWGLVTSTIPIVFEPFFQNKDLWIHDPNDQSIITKVVRSILFAL